ncbi:MAG: cytochrome c oxidase subunit I [Chloroflexi bacterium]|nr:MAG: cytochrome c oxidase subunit I [Chloroflexi bacterium OLB13]MBC6954726.1 cytochrome c oxidase subunit I [Chloroflexota bacterium]MBV6436344.1 cytochrome c oxidase subunit 1 [Anaerolineae bacterium]MDL1914971.1 cytochrome c oxidase subunit I [Anaerolineae bacterium CFX4]MBW7879529.1 cytochrome c oxidase subunit I [Anaerolineae bacterium]
MASISVPMPGVQPAPRPKLAEYLRWSVDHKIIGVQYMATAFFFFIIGGALAMLVRWELLTPALDASGTGSAYNSLFTMHATIMIFMWIIPMFAGFGNYIVPLQLGAKDMAFPWLNAFAFWLLPPAGVLFLLGYFVGPAETGWTAYPPLSVLFSGDGQTLWAISIHIAGVSSILGAINFIVTIKNMRPEGMGWFQMPLFAWAVLATAIIQILATPFLAGGLTLLILDRVAGTAFFDPSRGGDVLVWQNVFWFYSHPAVYLMVVPGMGILSEVLSIHSRKPVFGYKMVALSSIALALIGFTVWAHHMFTSLTPQLRVPFMITSFIIAVPTGIKIFSWIATLWGGKIRFTAAMLFSIGFLSQFVIGGITGMMLGAIPVDIHLHDTYFVVSHFHFVLFGGSVFAIYAGIYHWWPKITGRMMNEFWGRVHFAITYVAFFFTFFPMHLAGMQGMPRRVAEYAPEFQTLNVIISISAFVLGISTFIILANMIWAIYRGKVAGPNPWRALTLEWQTSSPPPAYNFKGTPIPFDDPYGYGTEAANAYLAAMEELMTPAAQLKSGRSAGPASASPEPVAGD